MLDMDNDDDEELRLHIHYLLRDYSRTHYTTNYIDFTENLVAEFVEGLKPIPLSDPYSPIIPPDPFDVFSRMHGLSSLAPYDEIPQTTKEARLYLKKFMDSMLGIPRSDRAVQSDDYGRDIPLYQPLFVALSRKSRQSTPKLGSKKQSHTRILYRDLLKAQKITEPIQIEEIEDPPLSNDIILQLALKPEPEDLLAVRSLLQTTSDRLRIQKGYKNKYLDATLPCDDSPGHVYKPPVIPFVPIFPKARMPRSGMAPIAPVVAGLQGFADIPSKILPQVEVDHSDDDISMQNLMVVDGWETVRSSPPTSSSVNMDNSDEQIGELILHSTPTREPAFIDELFNAQIEVPQFPRSRKIGGNSGIKPHILAGKTLTTFLQPLLVNIDMQEPVVEQRSSPDPSSLFGQPASALERPEKDEVSPYEVHDDLDVEIENLYKDQNLQDFIMDEVIDEKQGFLMQVPDLPEPNVYARKEITFPTKFPEFLIPPKLNGGKALPYQFLKKTRGTQSLALALSWLAFTTDEKLPTITEAAVTDLFDRGDVNMNPALEMDLTKAEMKIRSVSFTDSLPMPADHLCFLGEERSTYRPPDPWDGFKMSLNRSERRRLAKLEGRINDMKNSDSDDPVVGDHIVGRVRKESSYDFDDAILTPTKRPRLDILTDNNNNTDEAGGSGILSCASHLHAASTDMVLGPDASYDGTEPVSDSIALRPCEKQEETENWPSFYSSSAQYINAGSDYYPYYDAHPEYMQELEADDPELADFQPLSFESRLPVSGLSSQTLYSSDLSDSNDRRQGQDLSMDTSYDISDSLVSKTLEPHPLLELSIEPEMAHHHLGIQAFAQLRAKAISSEKVTQVSAPAPILLPTDLDHEPGGPPADIYDSSTIRLPENVSMPQSVHKYMACLDIIQKRALVYSLRSQECLIDLAERQSLDGVDLIIDFHSAIIFISLFTLASQCDKYVERVAEQSWKFRWILIIFEAYPSSCALKGNKSGGATATLNPGLYAYTPPILKAIKKFRRDLNIASACGTKCQEMEIFYVFADSVDEGALSARLFGDVAEERDETEGAIWGDREWLNADFLEDEEANLASADGFNRFSASIILCQVSLQEFLNIEPEERIARFSRFIGAAALETFNIDLEHRRQGINE